MLNIQSGRSINQGTSQPGGVIVYQMTIRYALINGLKVTGGVRVQLDMPRKTGYVQLISLLNEVYLTHYVTSMSFLPPTSAAGVAWSAIPWCSTELGSCMQDDDCCMRGCNCKPSVNTKVETAQVIFCDPNHAQRFKTVLDTINSAFGDECYMQPVDPCLPYQMVVGGAPIQGHCGDDSTAAQNPSCFANHGAEPINLGVSGCPAVCCLSSRSVAGGGQCDSRPDSSMGQCLPTSGDPDDPYAYTSTRIVPGQVNAHIQGADPYLFTTDRILFSAPACLVKLESKKHWRKIWRGTIKIVQQNTGVNFSLVLETPEGNICSHHFISSNMNFEPSCKTQFGYTFRAESVCRGARGQSCSVGSQVMEDYLISFQSQAHFDQFCHVITEIQRCLQVCISPEQDCALDCC